MKVMILISQGCASQNEIRQIRSLAYIGCPDVHGHLFPILLTCLGVLSTNAFVQTMCGHHFGNTHDISDSRSLPKMFLLPEMPFPSTSRFPKPWTRQVQAASPCEILSNYKLLFFPLLSIAFFLWAVSESPCLGFVT